MIHFFKVFLYPPPINIPPPKKILDTALVVTYKICKLFTSSILYWEVCRRFFYRAISTGGKVIFLETFLMEEGIFGMIWKTIRNWCVSNESMLRRIFQSESFVLNFPEDFQHGWNLNFAWQEVHLEEFPAEWWNFRWRGAALPFSIWKTIRNSLKEKFLQHKERINIKTLKEQKFFHKWGGFSLFNNSLIMLNFYFCPNSVRTAPQT